MVVGYKLLSKLETAMARKICVKEGNFGEKKAEILLEDLTLPRGCLKWAAGK